jgi:ATP-dependent DNA ligase
MTRDQAEPPTTLTSLALAGPAVPVPAETSRDRWVKPKLQAEVEYRDLNEDRLLRHAAFKGLATP